MRSAESRFRSGVCRFKGAEGCRTGPKLSSLPSTSPIEVPPAAFTEIRSTTKVDPESQVISAPMETLHTKEAMTTAPNKDNDTGEDRSTSDEFDPWDPPYPTHAPVPPGAGLRVHLTIADEWMTKIVAVVAKSRATNIIIPDRTPQAVNNALLDTLPRLKPILKKDSIRCFLTLFERSGRGMGSGYIITPETFNHIILHNALQCAKLVLRGQAPELNGFRANPNYMTQYGYFPLHKAAEMFSVEMIELLFRYGALANLRTAGDLVIEGLLPLHVAVENTCLHKYIEENLFRNQELLDHNHADDNYLYKLIHLLCLPEMKIFLDTTRLLAKHTDNLFDELCNYIKDGKLAQTAVLLLAAQKQIRMGTSKKRNVNTKPDNFTLLSTVILSNMVALHKEARENTMEQKQLETNRKINVMTLAMLLNNIISRAGEALDSYIQAHPKVPYFMGVPHSEVFERVSFILKEHGFCPTGDLDIGNLCPFKNVLSYGEQPDNFVAMVATKGATTEMNFLHAAMEKAAKKKEARGWELKLARRSFFPYWRAVLVSKFTEKVRCVRPMITLEQIEYDRALNKSSGIGSTFPMKDGIPQLRTLQPRSLFGSWTGSTFIPVKGGNPQLITLQPRRLFGSAALTLLRVLKNA